MTSQELLKKSDTYDILKAIAGCHVYIKMALEVLDERLNEEKGGNYVS